jgi:hypothetical protein
MARGVARGRQRRSRPGLGGRPWWSRGSATAGVFAKEEHHIISHVEDVKNIKFGAVQY